jgi:hypothetical protein
METDGKKTRGDAFSNGALWLIGGLVLGIIWRRINAVNRHDHKFGNSGLLAVRRQQEIARNAPEDASIGSDAQRPESTKRRFIPSAMTMASLLLGIALLVIAFVLYSNIVSPAKAPIVPGQAELYVRDPSIPSHLSVYFPLNSENNSGSEVSISLIFTSAREVPDVAWALVISGDACFAEHGECISSASTALSTFLPEGAKVALVREGQPPFKANPKDSLVQVIYGTTKMDKSNGHAGESSLTGFIKASVVVQSGPSWDLTLPSYGRLAASPLFDFPNRPGALDLSIPGDWHRPTIFEVDVTANSPGNDSNHHVDVASPPLTDPLFLRWDSGESIRGVVQRTDLRLQARQQDLVFALGAIVGAAASLVLFFFQWGLAGVLDSTASLASRSWRAARSKMRRVGSRP